MLTCNSYSETQTKTSSLNLEFNRAFISHVEFQEHKRTDAQNLISMLSCNEFPAKCFNDRNLQQVATVNSQIKPENENQVMAEKGFFQAQ